jgi:cysteinyl-tRNA synthetase
MAAAHLGETIDIHAGGIDLQFPHHENEIAQSRCAHEGAPLARDWVHNGFLSMAGSEKMSKSLGNVVTVADLLAQGHKGEVLRFALLSAHYRQPLEWSDALIAQSKATLDRLYIRMKQGRFFEDEELTVESCDPEVVAALADDLNTPLALAKLSAIPDPKTLTASGFLLGLFSRKDRWPNFFLDMSSGESERVDRLVSERTNAKARRDFAEADRIRAELAAEGIVLEDGPQGTSWRRA